jgi:alpha-tubulin suppressor-like RCC1 family protein
MCGREVTLGVTETQLLFGWKRCKPTPCFRLLPTRPVSQVCTTNDGNSFLALSDGIVYTWGAGNLGLGEHVRQQALPTPVGKLLGTPIQQIAAGDCHTLCLSRWVLPVCCTGCWCM